MEKAAINGGKPAITTPFVKKNRFGKPELVQLKEALDQGTLFYWNGKKVKQFTEKFAELYGVPYCVATSSGTASVHTAIGALGIQAGDEIITTSLTDLGTVIGPLYQQAVPVFADIDPLTYNIDVNDIEHRITARTKAIIVVHLAGNPADMDPIMDIARRHNLKVIEDCAQSYCCRYKGRLAGTIGDIGCFSLNDFKHISSGDGGMVIMRDEELYTRAFRFVDKNYLRLPNVNAIRDIVTLAPNYRMSELAGAVAIAQLDRVESICARRHEYGTALTEGIAGLPGVYAHKVMDGCYSSYWFFLLRINADQAGATAAQFNEALAAEGMPTRLGYTKCVYLQPMFQNHNVFPGKYWPQADYPAGLNPISEAVNEETIFIPIHEDYTKTNLRQSIKAIRKVAAAFGK